MAPTSQVLTDERIASLTPQERRELIRRLRRHPAPERLARQITRARTVRLSVLTVGSVVLLPWIVYLSQSLPPTYQARHWQLTWTGFDIVLLTLMILTAVLGATRRMPIMLIGFATGVLLLCDAWFDITTASPTDRTTSILSAVLAEVPVSLMLMTGSWRMLHVVATTLWYIEPEQSLWRARLQPVPRPGGDG